MNPLAIMRSQRLASKKSAEVIGVSLVWLFLRLLAQGIYLVGQILDIFLGHQV